jgi:hypothetical protein
MSKPDEEATPTDEEAALAAAEAILDQVFQADVERLCGKVAELTKRVATMSDSDRKKVRKFCVKCQAWLKRRRGM